jgi:hypothetical protein
MRGSPICALQCRCARLSATVVACKKRLGRAHCPQPARNIYQLEKYRHSRCFSPTLSRFNLIAVFLSKLDHSTALFHPSAIRYHESVGPPNRTQTSSGLDEEMATEKQRWTCRVCWLADVPLHETMRMAMLEGLHAKLPTSVNE